MIFNIFQLTEIDTVQYTNLYNNDYHSPIFYQIFFLNALNETQKEKIVIATIYENDKTNQLFFINSKKKL